MLLDSPRVVMCAREFVYVRLKSVYDLRAYDYVYIDTSDVGM